MQSDLGGARIFRHSNQRAAVSPDKRETNDQVLNTPLGIINIINKCHVMFNGRDLTLGSAVFTALWPDNDSVSCPPRICRHT